MPTDKKLTAVLLKVARAQGQAKANLRAPVPFGTLTLADSKVLARAAREGKL